MSLALGSQMEEGQDMEEDDVFGRSSVFKNRKDTVVGQETLVQSGGVQEPGTRYPERGYRDSLLETAQQAVTIVANRNQ